MTTQAGGGGRQPFAAVPGSPGYQQQGAGVGGSSLGVTRVLLVGQEGRPISTVVPRAMYENLPGSNYLGHDQLMYPDFGALGDKLIYTLAVPSGQVLDVSSLTVVVPVAGPGGGLDPVPDYLYYDSFLWYVLIGGKSPWDQYAIGPGAPGVRQMGWRVLNQNVLTDWGDTPVHLAVMENQTLEVRLVINAVPPIWGQTRSLTRVRARWIAKRVWTDIVNVNLGGA